MNGIGPAVRLLRHRRSIELVVLTPIVGRSLRTELETCLKKLAGEPHPLPIVIRSRNPRVFLAGADLAEIADLDVDACVSYAEIGRRLVSRLGQHPTPIVAAVRGTCAGGGFDLALACDTVVAHPQAVFRHPGARRGLVTGWTGTAVLPAALGASTARRAFLETAPIDAATMSSLGLAISISSDTERAAASEAERLAALGDRRLRLWRSLRGPRFVDRFLASVVHKL